MINVDQILTMINIAGQIKDAIEKADNIKVKTLLAAFQEAAVDAKLQTINAKEEVLNLREEIASLKQQLDIKKDLIQKEDRLYYSKSGPGGPYCPRCYESVGKRISLKQEFRDFNEKYWQCPECDNDFGLTGTGNND